MSPADRNRLWLAAILAGLTLWGGVWFYRNFERATYDTRSDQSLEARRNPLLAAQRLIERMEIPVESLSGRERLLQPPEQPGLMLVYHLGADLSAEAEERLLDWVAAGGHLVIAPGGVGAPPDAEKPGSGNRLLDRLEVWLEASDFESGNDPPPAPSLTAQGEILTIDFSPNHRLQRGEIEPIWEAEDDLGTLLMQFAVGSGLITVLSDNGFLDNDEIGKHDHALLLARLAGEAERVWLLYASDMPPLLSVIRQRAPLLLPAILIAVFVWGWSLLRRSGPLLPEERRVRRNLMEHLSAAAEYAWRVDRAGRMFQQSREEIEQEWTRRHPVLARLSEAERVKWIGERTGIAPRAIHDALYGGLRDEQGFIATTLVQQRLATALRGGRAKRENGN